MWVVKIGGSLSRDPLLQTWLRELNELGGGRVVIVPGGGGFADQVREHQAVWRFDDLAAHNMAVLAMAQHALMMQGLCRRLVVAATEPQIRQALHAGRTAVWAPFGLLRQEADTLTSWDVTSDSLAAWLANRLNAERLMIVKSCAVDSECSVAQLAEKGVLDKRFAELTREASYPLDILNKNDWPCVRELLLNAVVS
ncbi:aspartate kinase [Paraburkholderia sacchari]|uniref:amino acid kinase family protein n=1 Tax=Paraburkholderia sacchari TaxID=159450 RepID=UPI000543DB8D|nr:aspartate kinase [Paraburkholderia sacchari]NLP62759.1 aspartate kinase [Paraburkholderia sacchari]